MCLESTVQGKTSRKVGLKRMEDAYHTYLVYCLKKFGLHAKTMENHLKVLRGGRCDIRVSMKG